jgi:SNF2 family DNA or RNA helicase
MPYSVKQLLADYSSRTMTRARDYAHGGRVLEIEADEPGRWLTAKVDGTQAMPYEVVVDWASGHAEGDCDCPVGIDCKHAAAATMVYFEGWKYGRRASTNIASTRPTRRQLATQASPTMFEDWLERMDRARRPAGGSQAKPSPERLLYILGIEPWEVPRVRIDVSKGRLRKDGSFGGVAHYDPKRPLFDNRARFVQDVDMEALYRLAGEASYFSGRYTLDRSGNGELLKALLATGRCFWQSADSQALALGGARQGRWRWAIDETGAQRLTLQSSSGALGLPLAPSWYVDIKKTTLGPLKADLPDALVKTLLQSPKLKPEEARTARERLTGHLPDGLPQPHEVTIEERVCAPTPVLRLGAKFSLYATSAGRDWRRWMTLGFDYDGIEVAAMDQRESLERVEGDRVIQTVRDIGAERQAADVVTERFELAELGYGNGIPEDAVTLMHASDWPEFVANTIPMLEREGWRVEMSDDFPLRPLGESDFDLEIEVGNNWFDLALGVEVEGERVNLLPLLLQALASLPRNARSPDALDDDRVFTLPIGRERMVTLRAARLKPILRALIELYDPDSLTEEGRLRLNRLDAPRLAELDEADGLRWRGGKALKKLGRKLKEFDGIKRVSVPSTFKGELRDYQHAGLDWLQFLRGFGLNGILADDMGLGKTIQMLAHLLVEKRARRLDRPSLLVAPTSVLHNWCAEAERFAPSLKLLTLHGADRREYFDDMCEYDLVLTTYPLLPRDAEVLQAESWYYVVLDEAQVIKNPRTKAARIACELDARHRVCLTGTPMENNLGELWSLFRFLMPRFLGDSAQFRKLYRTPIEKHDDGERRENLARRIRPFLLRRTKDGVAAELPPKTEMVHSIDLEGAQRDLYESVRLAMHKKVRDVVANKGFARSHIEILEALLKLRQVCCDPRLLKQRTTRAGVPSAKFQHLLELVSGLLEDGRRVLLFSQFTEMLGLIETELTERDIRYTKLTGRTRNRARPVTEFQSGGVPLMLVSLKAGGVGLNLTAADAVIHYDPWWNPAVESQATDRAHRIGQDKPVFVYKLICSGTVEEQIQTMQKRKQALLSGLYGKRGNDSAAFNRDDLEALFEPL